MKHYIKPEMQIIKIDTGSCLLTGSEMSIYDSGNINQGQYFAPSAYDSEVNW